MSNKAKKAKQAQLRKRQQTRALNRARGQAKNYGLNDKEAAFYKAALANKETPLEFLNASIDNLNELVSAFALILDVGADEEMMGLLAQGYKAEHDNIKKAYDYLTGFKSEVEALGAYREEFAGLSNNRDSFLQCGPVIETFMGLQDELAENSANLIATQECIMNVYIDLDKETKEEGNDNLN